MYKIILLAHSAMLETSGNLEAVYGIRSDVSSRSNHSTRGMLPVRELV